MRNITIDLQSSDTRKIQLIIATNFISSKDTEKECLMHSKSDSISFKHFSDVNEVINEHFESLCSRYQENLETSMRGSAFIFDSVQLMYYKCYKVNFKRGGLYIDSPDWVKNEKVTTNPNDTGDKCF